MSDYEEQVRQEQANNGHAPAPALLLWNRNELANLPRPAPLIANTLDLGTVAVLAGHFGTLKSFIALGWSATVATGQPWCHRDLRIPPAPVLYLGTEGGNGFDQRLAAWESWNGALVPPSMFYAPSEPVRLTDTQWVARACRTIRDHGFRFLTVDILSKAISGLDENSSRDMSEVVNTLYELLAAMPAPGVVLANHHTGKDRLTTRGSSVLEDNVDTVYRAVGDSSEVELSRQKRKDGPQEDTLQLHLELVPDSSSGVAIHSHGGRGNSPTETMIISHLSQTFGGNGATRTQLKEVCSGVPPTSFYRALNTLQQNGSVTNKGTDKMPFYVLPE